MIIQNKKLHTLLKEAGDLVTSVKEITKQISDLEESRNKLAIKHAKVKEKLNPMIKEYFKKLGEYEDIMAVEIVKDAKGNLTEDVEIKITDRLEEWKKNFAEEKAKVTAK